MTYRLQKLGVIQRIELPAVVTKKGLTIDMSTVDYIGHYKGFPVAADAKECKDKRLSFHGLSAHQVSFLRYWKESSKEQHKVLSGFFIYFYELEPDFVYLYEIEEHLKNVALEKKSISIDEVTLKFPLNDSLLESYFFK